MAIKLPRKPTFRKRRQPPVDMRKHLTGEALITHIEYFDKYRGLRPGNTYRIGGKEVVI